MARITIIVFVVGALTLPVAAQDCSGWELRGIRPGMTFEEVANERTFEEVVKHRDAIGYRRYVWWSEDKLEKIDLHVDMRASPPSIVGVMTSIPRREEPPKEFLASRVERWGPPTTSKGQGAFSLYTWRNEACDSFVLVSVRNEKNAAVGIETALRSISAHEEQNRRLRERAAEKKKAETGD